MDGPIDEIKGGDLEKDGVGMGELADTIDALPDDFARTVFNRMADKSSQAETTAAVQQSNVPLASVVDH